MHVNVNVFLFSPEVSPMSVSKGRVNSVYSYDVIKHHYRDICVKRLYIQAPAPL